MPNKNFSFLIPLTEEEKQKYEQKRRREGLTSQGLMRKLVLNFINEETGNDINTNI